MNALKRIVTPIFWILTLGTFFLPWTVIGCNAPDNRRGSARGYELSSVAVSTQNGFEAATGRHSLTKDGQLVAADFKDSVKDLSPGPAYLVWLLLLMILVCIVAGIALPIGGLRRYILPSAAAIGFIALAVQSKMGLPAQSEEFRNKLSTQMIGSERYKTGSKLAPVYASRHAGFVLLWALFVVSALLTLLDLVPSKNKAKKAIGRKRHNDDNLDEEQRPPPKSSRSKEDPDEDDQPKKKSRR